jgi:3-oxoacyl-[acyl-carrier protein] reductase
MRRVALVTGASGGIGSAVAKALAADGLAVACAYLSNEAGAKESVEAIVGSGGEAQAFAVDVSVEEQVREAFRAVESWAGPPLVLVNNAGVSVDGLAVRYPVEDFERTLSVNLIGAFLCSREALRPMLKARWGRIVNVSSAVGLRGNPGQTAYAASKAGLIGLTRSLAREVGRKGIVVNAVCPGFVDTDMTEELSDDARAQLLEATPAGRVGRPEEVAAVVRLLASDDGSYVNGAVIPVDGGLTA